MLGYSRSVAHSAVAIRQLKEDAASCRRRVAPGHIPLGDKCEFALKSKQKTSTPIIEDLEVRKFCSCYTPARFDENACLIPTLTERLPD